MRFFTLTACVVLCVISVALFSPGAISSDTSIQLYEAFLGQSISWNPPMMSSILAVLGGGELATSLFVALCSMLTYLGFAIIIYRLDINLEWWKYVIIIVLVFNPIVFTMIGVVWKDVLFSSLIVFYIALNINSIFLKNNVKIYCSLALSLVILSIIFYVRQQGPFISVVLFLLPTYLLLKIKNKYNNLLIKSIFCTLLLLFVTLSIYVTGKISDSIVKPSGASYSIGLKNLAIYDITGIVAYSDEQINRVAEKIDVTDGCINLLKSGYSPVSIDFIDSNIYKCLDFNSDKLRENWLSLIAVDPYSYIKHRSNVFAVALGYDQDKTKSRPAFHIGIQGVSEYLAAVNISEVTGHKSRTIWHTFRPFYNNFLSTHAFWFVITIILSAMIFLNCCDQYFKLPAIVVSSASLFLFFLSFVTNLSWDYRYLYPIIPMETILIFIMFLKAPSENYPVIE